VKVVHALAKKLGMFLPCSELQINGLIRNCHNQGISVVFFIKQCLGRIVNHALSANYPGPQSQVHCEGEGHKHPSCLYFALSMKEH
jgi:hypothetical protein